MKSASRSYVVARRTHRGACVRAPRLRSLVAGDLRELVVTDRGTENLWPGRKIDNEISEGGEDGAGTVERLCGAFKSPVMRVYRCTALARRVPAVEAERPHSPISQLSSAPGGFATWTVPCRYRGPCLLGSASRRLILHVSYSATNTENRAATRETPGYREERSG